MKLFRDLFLILLIFLSSGMIYSCHLEKLDPIKNGLIADFAFTVSNSDFLVPIDIEFQNQSLEAVSYEWDFGDGSRISTEFNPTHTFYKQGDYTVSLKAINNLGEEDLFQLPITLKPRKYRKEYFYDSGVGQLIINNGRFLNDTTYEFVGHALILPYTNSYDTKPVTFCIDLDGELTDTISYYSYGYEPMPKARWASIPNYYLENNIPTTVDYDDNGNVYVQSFSQPDLFIDIEYNEFGKPIDLAEGLNNTYIVGEYNGQTNLLNINDSYSRNWPVSISHQCEVFDIENNYTDGVILIGKKYDNTLFEEGCKNIISLFEFNSTGDLVIQKEIPYDDPESSWRFFVSSVGKYFLVGFEFGTLKVEEYSSSFEKLNERFIEDIKTHPHKIVETPDGDLFLLEEYSVGVNSGIGLTKVTSDFTHIWTKYFDFPTKVAYPSGVIPTSDCGGLLFGNYYAGFNPYYPFFIKFDENGNNE